MPLIEAKNMGLIRDGQRVLSHVDFTVNAGEIVTIVGPNGSGKTSLLRLLLGALPPSQGAITRQTGLKIGYVPQKMNVRQSLPMTVRRFLSLPTKVDAQESELALEMAGAEGLAERQMSALSGGQFQRVLLARATLGRPDILMLDEPTQGLDQPGSAMFYRQIETVRDTLGCAVLMVSHELHVVMSASDRVICLNGHVCCEGTPDVVSSAPAYRELFGTGTGGALALYRHDHDHEHDHNHGRDHRDHTH